MVQGASERLFSHEVPNSSGRLHHFRLGRVIDSIGLTMGGEDCGRVTDDRLVEGKIGFRAKETLGETFRRIEIRPLHAESEEFEDGLDDWKRESGDWRIMKHDEAGVRQFDMLGSGNTEGKIVAPFTLETDFEILTSLQLLSSGQAGIAICDEQNADDAAVLISFEEAEGGSIELACGPERQTAWSEQTEDLRGKWTDLRISYQDRVLSLYKENELLYRGAMDLQAGAGYRPSFLLGENGQALFSRLTVVKGRSERFSETFDFEPESADMSLSYWSPVEGSASASKHPAYLECSPDPQTRNVSIRYRATTRDAVDIQVSFLLDRSKPSNPEDPLAFLDSVLPMADSRTRMGIRIESRKREDLVLSVDRETWSDLVVERNGKKIWRNNPQPPQSGKSGQLFLTVGKDKCLVGTSPGTLAEVDVDQSFFSEPSESIDLIGRGIETDRPMRIEKIVLRQYF